MKKLMITLLIMMILLGGASAVQWDIAKLFTGVQKVPSGAPWIADDQKMYFGNDKDASIEYDEDGTNTLLVTGMTALTTTGMAVGSGLDITYVGGDSIFDASLGSGIFKTTTGAVTIGPGATALTGATTITNLAAITAGSGSAAYNLVASTGAFTTSTGANTLSGDTTISGSKTFTTGTGAVAINGDITLAATKGITKTAGAGNINFAAGTGFFNTTTGTNYINGNIIGASGKSITMTGTGTFTTGTGLTTIGGIEVVTGTSYLNSSIIHAGDDITYTAGDGVFDAYLGTGIFNTTSGANTLNGDTTIAGAKTFTTGTGAIGLNGAMTIAATKGITKTAGAGNFDFSAGSGTFLTSYGANTLSGDTTLAAGKDFSIGLGDSAVDLSGGSGVFKTTTGLVTIGPAAISATGDVTVAANKGVALITADKLTVGGKIVPDRVTVTIPITNAMITAGEVNGTIFIADAAYKVITIKEVHPVAETTATTASFSVMKMTGTQAVSSGVLTTTAVIDLKGTAETVVTPALSATSTDYTLAAGNRLGIWCKMTGVGSLTQFKRSCVTITLERV
jgi:hypothetical protein